MEQCERAFEAHVDMVLANHECSFGAGLRGQRVTIDYIARLKRWVPNVLQARAVQPAGPAWANPLPSAKICFAGATSPLYLVSYHSTSLRQRISATECICSILLWPAAR
jgi:hypothetical protein